MSLKDNYIELSKKLGGPYSLISRGVKEGIVRSIMRGSIPRAHELYEVAKVLGVTVERLLTGKDTHLVCDVEQPIHEEDGYSIPIVEGTITAGTGAVADDRVKGYLWLPKQYLKSPAGYECRYVAVQVEGDSMEPLLSDGELVIIDRVRCKIEDITSKGIFAVNAGWGTVVKHLKYDKKTNTLQLISANPEWLRIHGVEVISLDACETNPIVGKVVFSLKKWK